MATTQEADLDDWVDVNTPDTRLSLPVRPKQSTKDASDLYNVIHDAACALLESHPSRVFNVDFANDEEPLYETFLKHLPSDLRQEYTCSTCTSFVAHYGDLVLVESDGTLTPVLWSCTELGNMFQTSATALRDRFKGRRVTEELRVTTNRQRLGNAHKGGFDHLHLDFPAKRTRKYALPAFAPVATTEAVAMLRRVLEDYDVQTVRKTHAILAEHRLMNADQSMSAISWLLQLMEDSSISRAANETDRHNLLARHASEASGGRLKQLRSGALSTLLENIKAEAPWHVIQNSWNSINDPIKYMRPQAAPSEGQVAAAEKLMAQLGVTEHDLERRLLVQEDVPENVIMWHSQHISRSALKKPQGGIFRDVKTKSKLELAPQQSTDADEPAIQISLSKFVTKILPKITRLQAMVRERETITMLITGLPETKPLMQWHTEENRASGYVWRNPPPVDKHDLKANDWNEVRCLIPLPHLWDGVPVTTSLPLLDPDENESAYKYYHRNHGFSYLFCLNDANEKNLGCLCLFPAFLKQEFHGIRSTIEAYSNKHDKTIDQSFREKGGHVGGIVIKRGDNNKVRLRATDANGSVKRYDIVLFE